MRICASKETGGENGTLLSPLPPSSWLSKKGEALVGQVAKNHLERRINTNLRKPAWQRNQTKVDVVLILKYILVTKIWCDCKRQNDDEWTILIQRRSYEESQPNLHSRCWCRHSWRRCCHRAQSQEVLGSLGRMIPSRCLAAPARDNQGDFFRRVGIFRTYPGESVSHSVSHTFRFPLCGCLCTVTEQLWATGFDIFSESNEQQLSDFNFQSVFLQSVPSFRIFWRFASFFNVTYLPECMADKKAKNSPDGLTWMKSWQHCSTPFPPTLLVCTMKKLRWTAGDAKKS